MLQTVSTSQHTFICVDALGECVAEYRQVVLKSLREIPEKSPGVQLFLTGRSYIRDEVQSILAEAAMFMETKPNKGDTVTYILAKLEEDTNKDAMNVRQSRSFSLVACFLLSELDLPYLPFSLMLLLNQSTRYATLFSLVSLVFYIVPFDFFSAADICCCFTA